MFRLLDALRTCPQATQIRQLTPQQLSLFVFVILYKTLKIYVFIHFITPLYFKNI